MSVEICSEIRYTRTVVIFMCYALIGSIIFSFLDYERAKNEEKREKLDKMVKSLAEKVTVLANDPSQSIDIETMKQYIEQAYTALRSIDEGNPDSPAPTPAEATLL
ncbi:hypothetical protein GCK32_012713 [Trichostrongylus colubriformis]|uniref:Uncharacterized protein n=1 Tax=Trichostrongylus colubriformis TaxID=6319 RepID=A0AAN8FPT2_TRICO